MNKHTFSIGVALLSIIMIPVWVLVIAPRWTKLASDFSYKADIVSLDNFYDENARAFTGEQQSVTKFSYEVTGEKNGVLLLKNIFDVRKITGENIISLERLYGIDPFTRAHVPAYGDRNREGYLFAPRHLREGELFTYWHINYDGPAHMTFAGKETLYGLPVFRYETHYEGTLIDQTNDLTSIPGVGTDRGIRVEPYLQIWVEPVSGHMVKYEDTSLAFFYDLKTGKRLSPWNQFRNTFARASVERHVERATQEKRTLQLLEYGVPVGFVFLALFAFLFLLRSRLTRTICILLTIAIAVCSLAEFLAEPKTAPPETFTGPLEKVRIGADTGPLATPVWIAEHNGYFREAGLDVEIEPFNSGRAAFLRMIEGDMLDIVTVAQTPIVERSFERQDIVIVAGIISSSNDLKILARKDRGIRKPTDLKGKKIGTTKNTTGHYFLGLYLTQHGLTLNDVTMVDLEAGVLSAAVSDGTVDAISAWEPHIFNAKLTLGDNAVQLESNDTFREDFYLATFKTWAKEHPELLKRLLIAIDRAETFIVEHPEESQAIIAKQLKLDPSVVALFWKDFKFRLFLDQAILLSLEHQARWMMLNGLVQGVAPPNYLNIMHFDILDELKPEAISILR